MPSIDAFFHLSRLADLMGCGEELKELVAKGHRDLEEKQRNSATVVGIGGIPSDNPGVVTAESQVADS